jgi:hypothetical protein
MVITTGHDVLASPGETKGPATGLLLRYEQYRRDNKVVPVPPCYTQIAQLLSNT